MGNSNEPTNKFKSQDGTEVTIRKFMGIPRPRGGSVNLLFLKKKSPPENPNSMATDSTGSKVENILVETRGPREVYDTTLNSDPRGSFSYHAIGTKEISPHTNPQTHPEPEHSKEQAAEFPILSQDSKIGVEVRCW